LVFHAVFVHLERFARKLLRFALVAGLLWLALLILRGVTFTPNFFAIALFPANTALDFV
jgi:hypothetical protein